MMELTFAEEMRVRRVRAGLTQEELGKLVGCSRQLIWMMETARMRPGEEMERAVREALDWPVVQPSEYGGHREVGSWHREVGSSK